MWERACGATLACGTGACAVVVASNLLGITKENVQVNLPGGSLNISWNGVSYPVLMTGPASLIFEGKFNINTISS